MKYLSMVFVIMLMFSGCDDGSSSKIDCTEGETKLTSGTTSTCKEGKWQVTRKTIQFGTPTRDQGYSLTIDNSGNIYIGGKTKVAFDGNKYSGYYDIFLTKFDSSGNAQWTKQFGTTEDDNVYSVAVDSAYNIYITGYTYGNIDGNTNAGEYDLFLTKIDLNGNVQWTKQFGTPGNDFGYSIAIDSLNNIYITGAVGGNLDGNTNTGHEDVFLMKFDTNGNKTWTKQFGTSDNDFGTSITIDSLDKIYITGYTYGNLDGNTNSGEHDMFLSKFNSDGEIEWIRQFGTIANDFGYSTAIDSRDNIYITGYTYGNFDNNTITSNYDIFLTKFNNSGDKQWIKQFDSSNNDFGYSIAIDSTDNIYITGATSGNLDGNTNAGENDIVLAKFNSNGEKQWTKQFGTSVDDRGMSLAIDSSDNIYIGGYTSGNLDGNTNAGNTDAFLTIIPAE